MSLTCPVCGNELEEGFLFSTKDGAFSFAKDVPSTFVNAKKMPGFTEITAPKVGGRTSLPARICRTCKTITIDYQEKNHAN